MSIKNLRKIVIIFMIIILINNFVLSSISNAGSPDDPVTEEPTTETALEEKEQGFLDSFIGLVTYVPRIFAIGIGYGINALTAGIAYIEGTTDPTTDTTFITPFDIFFNKVKILDVNFFEIGDKVNIVNTIRTGVATWYYVLRLIATAILLVMLIYVGIRMAISTIATDKAMYKKMLFDWVVSIVLIFLTNYIIIFVISMNNSIIDAIAKGMKSQEIKNTYSAIGALATDLWDIDSIPATIIFCMLVWQTLGLVINYFNRMLKVAFLIIISPLITLTYSVDKMGDGKAQALGNWIKEFVFTVAIQIFHCIIYMCFVNVAFELLVKDSTGVLTTSIMAILCVGFVKESENIVRKILMHNHQDSTTNLGAGTAMTVAAISKSKSLGKATIKSANVARQGIRTAGNALKGATKTAGRIAVKTAKAPLNIGSDTYHMAKLRFSGKYKEGKEQKKEDIKKNGGHYGLKHVLEYKRDTKAKIKSDRMARSKSRREKLKFKRKRVKGARGVPKNNVFSKLKEVRQNSDVYKVTAGIAKTYIGTGLGLATGSFMYGATGNVAQSVGMGFAGVQAVRAFTNTGKTMEARTVANLRAMGITNKKDAVLATDNILSNPLVHDEKSDEHKTMDKNLMKPIRDQVEAILGNPEYATKIKNTINSTAAGPNPELIREALEATMRQIAADAAKKSVAKKQEKSDGVDVAKTEAEIQKQLFNNEALQAACNNYINFANSTQIYKQVTQAQEFGISMDEYVQDIATDFVSTETSEERIEKYSEMSQQEIERSIEYLSTKDIEALTEELVIEFDEKAKEIAKANSEEERQVLEEQLEDLKKIEATLVSKVTVDKRRAFTEAERKLKEQVESSCKIEIERLLKELGSRDENIEEEKEDISKVATRIGIRKGETSDAAITRLASNLRYSSTLSTTEQNDIRQQITKINTYKKLEATMNTRAQSQKIK